MNILRIIGRTVFMYVFVLIVTRLMGKREIGQLSPFDLVVAIMIADLAALPLEEAHIGVMNAVTPILTLAVAEVLFAFVSLKSTLMRRIITGNPTILVENGRILEGNLKKSRYNLNDLVSQLRQQNVPNIADVEYAILETSGDLTVIPKSQKRPVTPKDLGIPTSYEGAPFPLIIDGQVQYDSLERANLSLNWLSDELHKQGIEDPKQVLYASLDTEGNLYVSKKEKSEVQKTQI